LKEYSLLLFGVVVMVGCAHFPSPLGFPFPEGRPTVGSPLAPNLPEGRPDLILPPPGSDSPPLVFLNPQPGQVDPAPDPPPVPVPSELTAAEQSILKKTNDARQAAGAQPLVADKAITQIARGRSLDMGTRNYFAHVNPDGKTALDLLREAGINYRSAGENIGKASGSPDETANTIFGMWMNSAGHKANLLSKSYGRIGIGAVQTGSTTYFTQVFAN
jgi:uncharacterized protein YkwD